ncbi:hypothetical protein DYST_00736 [Dyella terrae]|nr:hypothetical protein DYST_00736 [Dyella terrae]
MQTKECWRSPGRHTSGANYATLHRSRHRHVGDIRFAIVMVFAFALACGLAFRSDAEPGTSSFSAHVHGHTLGHHQASAAHG